MARLSLQSATLEDVEDHLLNGESAEEVRITEDERLGWLVVLNWGFAETVVARCDYERHARGIAAAIAYTVDVDEVTVVSL